MILYLLMVLPLFLALSAVTVVFIRNLFSLVVLMAVYSAMLAVTFAVMGAVDVAFMEAVVGTSVSTVFMMALMAWIDPYELTRYPVWRRIVGLVPSLGIGALLLYGVHALPHFGDPEAPAATHVSPLYVQNAVADMATPNVVAAVLADYRSLDTMIESAVVLTAVLACLLILMYRDDPAV